MAKLIVTNRDGDVQEVTGEIGLSVMEILRDNDFDIAAICGGMCSCATCHVFVDDEWLEKTGERQDGEEELLNELECYNEKTSRLSCQIEFTKELDGLQVEVAPDE